jgi:uncharacterized protein (TIGR00645 family)
MRRIVMLPSGSGPALMLRHPETDMQAILDKTMLASRWLLAVFFLGLAAALAVYAVHFLYKLWKFAAGVLVREDTRMLIELLYLLDSALVASLVVLVATSSYDNMVSRLNAEGTEGSVFRVATVDPGGLKVKLATALVAISSIHVLQVFMELDEYSDRTVTWTIALHMAFLAGVIVLGIVDRLQVKK